MNNFQDSEDSGYKIMHFLIFPRDWFLNTDDRGSIIVFEAGSEVETIDDLYLSIFVGIFLQEQIWI